MPLPPLPPGFTLDQQPQGSQPQGAAPLPPLPPGFTLDQDSLEAHQQALDDERINREGPYNWGGFAREAAQGASLYTSDEAEAAIRAAGLWPGANDPNKTYEQHLADVRQSMADFERRNPNTALAAQFAGGAATAFAAPELRVGEALGYKFVKTLAEQRAAEAAGYTAVPAAKTLAGQMGRSALTGAGYGGVAGFGAGEGGLGNRAESAGYGLETGGALGAAVPPALRTAGLVARPVRIAANAVMGTSADDALLTALRRDNMTPEQALQAYQEQQTGTPLQTYNQQVPTGQTNQPGPRFGPGSFAELPQATADLGPNMQRLAQTITAEPGAAQDIGTKFLEARAGVDRENLVPQTSQQGRINDALARALRVSSQPDFNTAVDNIVADQQRLSGPAYNRAYANPATFDVGPVLQAAQRDPDNAALAIGSPIRQAFDKAISFFQRPTGLSVPPLTEAVQGRALSQIMRRALPGTPERGIVESLQNDLASGQFPAASLQRQARFQVAIADMDRLRQTAATDAPRTYPRLTALRERIESASNIAGRPQNIQGLSTVMDTRQFDMSKRSLDGLIQAAQAKPELAQQAYVLTGLKKALVNRADESTAAVPGDVTSSPYYRARGIFSSRAELLDAAQQGRSLMRGNDTAMAGREFGAMSGPEQRMFRQGVAYEVRRMLGDKAYGEDTTRLFKKPNVQEVMALAFPANTAAFEPHAQFNRFVAREGNMQKTFQMGTKGSDTARIEAGKEDLKNLSIFGRAMRTVGPENAVWVALTEGFQQMTRMREATAVQIARDLFNSNPAHVEDTLNRLSNRYGSSVAYWARRQIQPRFPRLPGAVGTVAGSQQGQES